MNLRQLGYMLLLLAISVPFFTFGFIKSNKLADNPKGCSYYISLRTILANQRYMQNDSGNVNFIKDKLLKFEASLTSNRNNPAVKTVSQDYQKILKHHQISSINTVNSPTLILQIADEVSGLVDNYYFNESTSCVLPMYDYKKVYSRHLLAFNLGDLYYKTKIHQYDRILFSNDSGFHLGAFPGYFVNNQTTTLGTQFMTGMPLLTSLYVIPKYDFNKLGTYHGLVPWCTFSTQHMTDPFLRKLMNISGMDIYTVSKTEMIKRKDNGENLKLQNFVLVDDGVLSRFGRDYSSYRNLDSYGIAYLANNVTPVDTGQLATSEKIIRKYFAKPVNHKVDSFMSAVGVLYQNLKMLRNKYDVLIEDNHYQPIVNNTFKSSQVTIKSILGPRALFETSCPSDKCLFVFNMSAAPGWKAYVNNAYTPIYRVNYAFMGIYVPKGQLKIWFIYEPWVTLLCYLISIFSLIFIILLTQYGSIHDGQLLKRGNK